MLLQRRLSVVARHELGPRFWKTETRSAAPALLSTHAATSINSTRKIPDVKCGSLAGAHKEPNTITPVQSQLQVLTHQSINFYSHLKS